MQMVVLAMDGGMKSSIEQMGTTKASKWYTLFSRWDRTRAKLQLYIPSFFFGVCSSHLHEI